MKRLVFAFALLAVLVVPAPAVAKELANVAVCGPDGCKNFKDHSDLRGWESIEGPVGEIPAPAAYYEIRYTVDADGEKHTWSQWYVPSAEMFASLDEREGMYWMEVYESGIAELTKGLKPFPAPEITAVTIGSRRVTDNPASYLRLFTVQSTIENALPRGVADWEQVTFVSKQKSPWTLAQSSIQFSPSNGMLRRGIELLKLPDQLSADLRGGEPLAGSSSGFPWRTVLFALLGAAALIVAASFIRPLRRRVVVRRAPTAA